MDELVAGVAVDATAVLAAAEQGGLLTVSPRRVTFRHELTRRAIAGAVPAARLIALNQRVLAALTGRPGADVARIVHHAAQAGDAAAIAAYGPDAAREAARAGAHREAAAHYRLVLEHADRFALGERARLLEEYGIECYTLGAADLAVGAQQQAVELTRTLGDPVRLGASLRWLSRMRWWAGQRDAAEQAGLEAVTVLEQAGDHRLLALALSNQSQGELGAKPLATRVRGRLRALGVTRIPRGPLGGTRANPAGLTTRQIDVLRLLVQGRTNAQIAHELVLSVRTVDSHVAAVLGKLGARDRHDAAARATELDVLADK